MKRLLSLLILAFSLVLLTGCDFKLNTTANGQTAIDRKSIADEIYSKVKDDIERVERGFYSLFESFMIEFI